MSTLTKRLTAAVAGATALMLAAPMVATAAPKAPAVAVTVTPTRGFDTTNVVLHHNGDPRQGSITVNLQIQDGLGDNGEGYVRVVSSVAAVRRAVRVQIDRITLGASGNRPNIGYTDSTPVNSGGAGLATKAGKWVQGTDPEEPSWHYSIGATVNYSIRWSDGTLTKGTLATGDGDSYNDGNPLGASTDPRTVDAAGSTTLNHYGNPALGSFKINAGIRLYRNAGKIALIQPFATVTKGSKAVRVQIDHLEALGFINNPFTWVPDVQGWPYNATVRSSGTGASASLSTAITQVNPSRNSFTRNFKVAVYYSVRWTDGTLSTGRYLTPLSAIDYSFPGGQAH